MDPRWIFCFIKEKERVMGEDRVIYNIKKRIEGLQRDILDMQSGAIPKDGYADKVKELIFWRRSLIRRKRKIGQNDDDEI